MAKDVANPPKLPSLVAHEVAAPPCTCTPSGSPRITDAGALRHKPQDLEVPTMIAVSVTP